jgi:uncharacterized repeat protein (TIGR01451 family)
MFRKIVSNLPFSSALVGQLSFYAKRLRKEELTRRLGLIFTALAIAVQSLAVIAPPEATNAASPADFVSGGVANKAQFLAHYDKNTNRIQGLFNHLGITRDEIVAMRPGAIRANEVAGKFNWSRVSLYSAAQGQHRVVLPSGADFFYRPLALTQEGSLPYPIIEGHSARQGWFAIKLDCANLITNSGPKPAPTLPPPPAPAPPPPVRAMCAVPGKESLPAGDPNCKLDPVAACSALDASIVNRTLLSLSGKSSVANGATVSGYNFVIKDANGTVVKTIPVSSSQLAVAAPSTELTKAGNYTVSLAVATSVGEKTDATNCVKAFTIVPPKMCQYNPKIEEKDPECQPCTEGSNIWVRDPKCTTEIVKTKSAINLSQGGVNATTVKAKGGDKISYTIMIENRGAKNATNVELKEQLQDVVEYATPIDNGGAKYDTAAKVLSWDNATIKSRAKETRTFVVQVINPVPSTNTGASNGASFNCIMTNTFGNSVDVPVECPVEKVLVEQTVADLPHTGPRENMIFAAVLLSVVVYFWARSRQLGKEVRLVRRDVHAGAI